VLDVARFEADLRGALPRGADLAVTSPDSPSWRPHTVVRIATSRPAPILATLDARVAALGARHSPWVRDRDPLGAAMRRLIEDV
jgi:hypothetical protein